MCHAEGMGDKPGHYWDYREARWVRYSVPEGDEVAVPAQQAPAPADRPVVEAPEVDVRSG